MNDHNTETSEGQGLSESGPELTSESLDELARMERGADAPTVSNPEIVPAMSSQTTSVSARRDAIRQAIRLVAPKSSPGMDNARIDTDAGSFRLTGIGSVWRILLVIGMCAVALIASTSVVKVEPQWLIGIVGIAGLFEWLSLRARRSRARRQHEQSLANIFRGPLPILFWRTSERRSSDSIARDSLEGSLVDDFAGVGPVLAIGYAGFVTPIRGAANCYFYTLEWDMAFGILIKACGAVILKVGAGCDKAEELRTTLGTVDPERLILLASGGRRGIQDYQDFVSDYGALFKRGLPTTGTEGKALPRWGFFVGFDSSWRPRVLAAHEAAAHLAAGMKAQGSRRVG